MRYNKIKILETYILQSLAKALFFFCLRHNSFESINEKSARTEKSQIFKLKNDYNYMA